MEMQYEDENIRLTQKSLSANGGDEMDISMRYQSTLELCRLKLEQMKSSDLKVQQKINWMINVVDIRLKKIAR